MTEHDEAEHYMVCEVCGQAFDMRSLPAILYHSTEDHEPIPLDS